MPFESWIFQEETSWFLQEGRFGVVKDYMNPRPGETNLVLGAGKNGHEDWQILDGAGNMVVQAFTQPMTGVAHSPARRHVVDSRTMQELFTIDWEMSNFRRTRSIQVNGQNVAFVHNPGKVVCCGERDVIDGHWADANGMRRDDPTYSVVVPGCGATELIVRDENEEEVGSMEMERVFRYSKWHLDLEPGVNVGLVFAMLLGQSLMAEDRKRRERETRRREERMNRGDDVEFDEDGEDEED
mmetsp:Transcript_31690/g.58195  ORF Transcript_31690/g.58195 Transcript_31690/m.58195 type:complete len:241 (-) Transcript_31690:105-827(-)